ncbi:MAG: phenylalanine--tRNA ligase subunit beta [Nitrospinota bacterium]
MPVIGIPYQTLLQQLGRDIDKDSLIGYLKQLGCDVEGYTTLLRFLCNRCNGITEITAEEDTPAYCDACGFDFREEIGVRKELGSIDVVRMELLAVRPDMFDPGGLARALKGYMGIETGLKGYELYPSEILVSVDQALSNSDSYRPYIVCAVIKGLSLDEEKIKILMKLQENLHWALGRNRRHPSIGVYDFGKTSPDFYYTCHEPKGLSFTPLGYSADNQMELDRILTDHPKGKEFAFLLQDMKRFPILKDKNSRVLSMPPIINSEETKVTKDTKDIFIDVTGIVERVIHKAINILVSSILEMDPNAAAHKVDIIYHDKRITTPDFTPQTMRLSPERTRKIIGFDAKDNTIMELLKKMRHNVSPAGEEFLVEVPSYRNDILHERDLMEDAAIAYGYHNIRPSITETMTVGWERPIEALANRVRETMAGLGYLEVMTLMLTNPEAAYERPNLSQQQEECVIIENPASQEQSIIRTSLIPGILEIFEANIHNDLPQKIFEAGDISIVDSKAETGARDIKKVTAGIIGTKIGFSDIKAVLSALLHEMNITWDITEFDAPFLIPGRSARLISRDTGKKFAVMGEIHPSVLEKYSLISPVAIFEMDIE